MKFGHLIEYYLKNIFVEKSYTKCDGETIPRSFINSLKVSYSWFLSANCRRNVVKSSCRPLAFTLYNVF